MAKRLTRIFDYSVEYCTIPLSLKSRFPEICLLCTIPTGFSLWIVSLFRRHTRFTQISPTILWLCLSKVNIRAPKPVSDGIKRICIHCSDMNVSVCVCFKNFHKFIVSIKLSSQYCHFHTIKLCAWCLVYTPVSGAMRAISRNRQRIFYMENWKSFKLKLCVCVCVLSLCFCS